MRLSIRTDKSSNPAVKVLTASEMPVGSPWPRVPDLKCRLVNRASVCRQPVPAPFQITLLRHPAFVTLLSSLWDLQGDGNQGEVGAPGDAYCERVPMVRSRKSR